MVQCTRVPDKYAVILNKPPENNDPFNILSSQIDVRTAK